MQPIQSLSPSLSLKKWTSDHILGMNIQGMIQNDRPTTIARGPTRAIYGYYECSFAFEILTLH